MRAPAPTPLLQLKREHEASVQSAQRRIYAEANANNCELTQVCVGGGLKAVQPLALPALVCLLPGASCARWHSQPT